MSNKGYVKIHRKIKDDNLWPNQEDRSFTRFEAWIDLLLSAAGLPIKIIFREQPIFLKRGQMIIAERTLGERWTWSRGRVHRFMAFLKENGKIRYHRQDHRITIISIAKYNTYNPPASDIGPLNRTTDRTTGKAANRTNINKDLNINKDIKNKGSLKRSSLSQLKINAIFKWNALAQEFNLAPVIDINSGSVREKNLRARSAEKNFDFDLLIDMIRNSPFLLGKTKDPFFVFFDWIIKPTNYQKIIEGNYLDRRSYQRFSGIIDGIKDLKKQHKEASKNET